MGNDDTLKTTPLHQVHRDLGARMMPFAGYDMPVQYSGILDEHNAVRTAAGLFDVSHMGEVSVTGPRARTFVQHLVTNDVEKLEPGRAMYTVMCRPDGGIVDDLLVYCVAEDDYLLVINASNIEKDFAWMEENNPVGATLRDISLEIALLALQGPRAFDIAATLTREPISDIPYYHFRELRDGAFMGLDRVLLSHTGYTGEKGLEIYCRPADAEAVWRRLLEEGESSGLRPAGLGARDTLRLESGFALYGNDITDDTNPIEAGLGWVTKLDKGDFIGREALRKVKEEGPKRRLVGFVLQERGVPRSGYRILDENDAAIGTVTSGSQSPVLGQGIGLAYVANDERFTKPGSKIRIETRGRGLRAEVRKPPFHKG
jgi:aminomethyltransferase